jgi:hypothetical protein
MLAVDPQKRPFINDVISRIEGILDHKETKIDIRSGSQSEGQEVQRTDGESATEAQNNTMSSVV